MQGTILANYCIKHIVYFRINADRLAVVYTGGKLKVKSDTHTENIQLFNKY